MRKRMMQALAAALFCSALALSGWHIMDKTPVDGGAQDADVL